MVQKKGSRKLVTTIVVIGVLLLVVAGVAIVKSMAQPGPATPADTAQKDTPTVNDKADSTGGPAVVEGTAATEPPVDPAQTLSLDIEPMSITVSYMKSIRGFDFEVLRSTSGTKYVQFSVAKLVGTKCTDDKGQFASIIENPSADEATTLAKMVTVDGAEYGLSLAGTTCTNDTGLLMQYQNAISGAFSLLKKM